MTFNDLSVDDMIYFIKNFDKRIIGNKKYYLLDIEQDDDLDEFEFDYTIIDKFTDMNDSIPIKRIFINTIDNTVDMKKWFNFLKVTYGEVILEIDNKEFIGICYNIYEKKYEILNHNDFYDILSEIYDNSPKYYSDNHEFINFYIYEKKSLTEIVDKLFSNTDSISILRRNFRVSDIIKNNTKLGNEKTIKNKLNEYIDFSGTYFPEKSISKNTLTENGRKLKLLLDNLRGYIINNFQNLKEIYKNNTKFKGTIDTFKKINLDDLKTINNFDIDDIKLSVRILYGYINSFNTITITLLDNLIIMQNFFNEFNNINKFAKLINNQDYIEYLKNFINLSGSLRTKKDFMEFKDLINNINKSNIFQYKESIMELKNHKIDTPNDIIEKFNKIFSQRDTQKNRYEIITQLIKEILSKYFPELNIKKISNVKFDDLDTEFKIELNLK